MVNVTVSTVLRTKVFDVIELNSNFAKPKPTLIYQKYLMKLREKRTNEKCIVLSNNLDGEDSIDTMDSVANIFSNFPTALLCRSLTGLSSLIR